MAEPSHITNRNRGHRSRSRAYRPPIIKGEARLCPNCEKPTSLGDFRCRQCGQPISAFGSNQIPSPADTLFIQVAGGGRVFLAYFVDGMIALLAIIGLVLVLSQGEDFSRIRGAHIVDSALLWLASQLGPIAIASLTVFAAFLCYQCTPMARAGYTPGRRVAGIVLVHKKGRELSRTRLIIRACLSAFSWMFLVVGYFWPLLDQYHRSLHDICTQTILVQRKVQIP